MNKLTSASSGPNSKYLHYPSLFRVSSSAVAYPIQLGHCFFLSLVMVLHVTSTASAVLSYDIVLLGLQDVEHTRDDGARNSRAVYLNEAGTVVGISRRYNDSGSNWGFSAWLYDGTTTSNIGLIGPEHTRDDGYKGSNAYNIDEAGHVVGASSRFNGGSTDLGTSAWLHNGTTTIDIGLTGPEHTRDDGYKQNVPGRRNEAGQRIGTAARFNGGSTDLGRSAWLSNGTTTIDVGLTGPEHTRDDGYKRGSANVLSLNDAGMVLGDSERFNGGSISLGYSAWLYNGTTTIDVGLKGPEHTRDDGYKSTSYQRPLLNEAGQVVGTSDRYDGSSYLGQSAWLYNGTTTTDIGLTGPEHTGNNGRKHSQVYGLNDAGMAMGESERFNGGYSAWLYNGTTTIDVGLTGPEHTRDDGYKLSRRAGLNEAGHVIGTSTRYNGGEAFLGRSAWLYNGTTTIDIGLTGPEHTRDDGYKNSDVAVGIGRMNEAGQVTGSSERYNGGSTDLGNDTWFYDPVLDQTFSLNLSTRSDGFARSSVNYLGEDGLVLGTYTLFDALDNDLGTRAFYFTVSEGLHDLGSLVNGGLATHGWDWSSSASRTNKLGQILGWGKPIGQLDGEAPFLLTPIPEPGSAILWLVGALAYCSVARTRSYRFVHCTLHFG